MTHSEIVRVISMNIAALTTAEAIFMVDALIRGSGTAKQACMNERNRLLQDAGYMLRGYDSGFYSRCLHLSEAIEWYMVHTWPGMLTGRGVALEHGINGLLCKALVFGAGTIPQTDRGLAKVL